MAKYNLKCKDCGSITQSMSDWFREGQQCSSCKSKYAWVSYEKDIADLNKIIATNNLQSVFDYFDFLPIDNKENIVSSGEGVIPVEHWDFLDDFAIKQYGIDCKVHVYRNDLSPGTGTFKDVAAAVAASVLKENGIKQFAVASTGNIATSFAYYLAKADISLSVFIPNDSLMANEAQVSSYGQRVFRVQGDYAYAKKLAVEFAQKNNILISGGNIDPMRVEAKKTMVFEWLRQMGEFPTVYVQALSGGTGPIAIDKALDDIKGLGLVKQYPRYIMVQPSACNPMTLAWEKAKKNQFPEGWLRDYPIIEKPLTKVPILATGNPGSYPIVANLVHKSKGEIITFDESKMEDIARLVGYESKVSIGPASTISVGGFFESLKQGLIRNKDVVLINIGEGVRRAPDFMNGLVYTTKNVSHLGDCEVPNIKDYRDMLWSKVML